MADGRPCAERQSHAEAIHGERFQVMNRSEVEEKASRTGPKL